MKENFNRSVYFAYRTAKSLLWSLLVLVGTVAMANATNVTLTAPSGNIAGGPSNLGGQVTFTNALVQNQYGSIYIDVFNAAGTSVYSFMNNAAPSNAPGGVYDLSVHTIPSEYFTRGNYTVQVTAITRQKEQFIATTNITVNNVPTVTLTAPSGNIAGGPSNLSGQVKFINGTALGQYGSIYIDVFNAAGTSVYSFMNNAAPSNAPGGVYDLSVHTIPSEYFTRGNYTVQVTAITRQKEQAIATTNITVNNVPTVTLTAPSGNIAGGPSNLGGQVKFINGTARGQYGSIYIDVFNATGTSVYSFMNNAAPSNAPGGVYDLSVHTVPTQDFVDGTYTLKVNAISRQLESGFASTSFIIDRSPAINIIPDPGPYRYGDPVKGLIRVSSPLKNYLYVGSVTVHLSNGLTTSVSVNGLGDYPFSFPIDQIASGTYELTADGVLSGYNVSDGPATVVVKLVSPDEVLGGKEACKTCACKSVQVTGNPVQVATGNKIHKETDLSIGALNVTRHYHSRSTFDGSMGYGWSFDYGWKLSQPMAGEIMIRRDDGKLIRFVDNGAGVYQRQLELKHETVVATAGGWLYRRDDNSSVEFDVAGRLVALHREDGRSTAVAYDAAGNPANVTGPYGRTLTIATDTAGHISAITGPAGRIWSYTYDAYSNLTSIVYPDGATKQYQYADANDVHNLTDIIDEAGRVYAHYAYDAQDRAILTEHPLSGQRHSLVYNADGTVAVTEADGTVRTYTVTDVDGIPTVTAVSDSGCNCGSATSFVFDPYTGFLSSSTDKLGGSTVYSYDTAGHLLTRTEAVGTTLARTTGHTYDAYGHATSTTDALGGVTAYTYDAAGHKLTTADALGNVASNVWNADGTLANHSDAAGLVTSYSYDAYGEVVAITHPDGTSRLMTYDAAGRLLTLTDEAGATTTYAYDARDRVLSVTYADGTTVTNSYDVSGDLVGTADAAGLLTTLSYDVEHRPVAVTRPDGSKVTSTFDAKGNLTARSVLNAAGVSVTNETMSYDADGRLITTIHADATSTSNTYDMVGRLLSTTDEAGRITTDSYDALGRMISSTNPNAETVTYGYDLLDRRTSVTAANSALTSFTYDALGRVLTETSSDRGVTTYGYGATGELLSKTDGNGVVTNYAYDVMHRLIGISYPADAARSVAFAYDAAGRVTSMTDISGVTNYVYDVMGRAMQVSWLPAGSMAAINLAYAYDATGRLVSVTYPSGRVITYTYDAVGRIGAVDTTVNGVAQNLVSGIAYYPLGGISARTLGNGVLGSRSYDARGRLVMQQQGGVLSRALTWSPESTITAITDNVSSPYSQTFTYDLADRLTAATGGYGTIGYTYDSNGNRLSRTDAAGAVSSSYVPLSNRLANSGATAFTRDVAGNRLADSTLSYTYAVNNRLIAVADSLGNAIASYVHNGKGERTSKTVNGVTTLYMYDPAGNLIGEYDNTGAMVAEYVYGPSGRLATIGTQSVLIPGGKRNPRFGWLDRVKGWFASIGVAFADDDRDRRGRDEERDRHDDRDGEGRDGHGGRHGNHGGGNGHGGNGNGGGAFSTVEVIYWHHNDHLGTPQALTDINGTVIWTMDQTPFGIATVNEDPDGDGINVTNNFRFPGQYFDSETGLNYNYFRSYDPVIGAYEQSDPIGLKGGPNTYAYVSGNPIKNVDPNGLLCKYYQSTGFYYCEDDCSKKVYLSGVGYSGWGRWKNNPNAQDLGFLGPIPRGDWKVGPIIADGGKLGPNIRSLLPLPGNSIYSNGYGINLNRGYLSFYIHGDSRNPNKYGNASHGCIIMRPDHRKRIKDGEILRVI